MENKPPLIPLNQNHLVSKHIVILGIGFVLGLWFYRELANGKLEVILKDAGLS